MAHGLANAHGSFPQDLPERRRCSLAFVQSEGPFLSKNGDGQFDGWACRMEPSRLRVDIASTLALARSA